MTKFFFVMAAISFVSLSAFAFDDENPFDDWIVPPPSSQAPAVDDFPEASPAPRIYESAQGPIDLGKLEAILSSGLENSPFIEISSIRWTHDPMAYINYFVRGVLRHWSFGKAQIASYVMYMRVNGQHESKCDLLLNLAEGTGAVLNCRSKTASLNISEFFEFESVGLPFRPSEPTK